MNFSVGDNQRGGASKVVDEGLCESLGYARPSSACAPKLMENGTAALRMAVDSKINNRLIKLQAYRRTLSMHDAQSAKVLGTVRYFVDESSWWDKFVE
jgi:hypothetical protein